MVIKQEILAYIASALEKKRAIPKNIELADYRYIEAGHIDSLGIMKFIVQLEERYQIEISDDDMLSDSFQSVGGVAELIQSKLD